MTVEDRAMSLLRNVAVLRDLDDRTRLELIRAAEHQAVPAGTVLAREGLDVRALLIVLTGTADVFVDGERVAGVGEGSPIGENSFFDHHPQPATVRARTDMSVLSIAPERYRAVVEPGSRIEGGTAPEMVTNPTRNRGRASSG